MSKNLEISTLLEWQRSGKKVAIATVIQTWGSSPRPVGSHLIIDEGSQFVGSVSGGCIEGAVISEAVELLTHIDSNPKRLIYGVSDENAWEVGLSCGGKIEVLVHRLSIPEAEFIIACEKQKSPLALVTNCSKNENCLVSVDATFDVQLKSTQLTISENSLKFVHQLIRQNRSALIDDDLFVRCYTMPLRLIIIGAVHIAEHLTAMAIETGFDVIIIDPRKAFLREGLYPGAICINAWPDDALESLKVDNQTAIVTLTHDPKIDDAALTIALKSPAYYIGSLGSVKTHQKRIERLSSLGFAEETKKIHGPIGLTLGGRATAEIAVSILAELIQVRNA